MSIRPPGTEASETTARACRPPADSPAAPTLIGVEVALSRFRLGVGFASGVALLMVLALAKLRGVGLGR